MEPRSALRCAVVARLLPAAAAGALDPVEQVGVTTHLLHCTACRATFEEYESLLLQLAYAVPRMEPPAHLRIHLMRTIGAPAGLPIVLPVKAGVERLVPGIDLLRAKPR